MKQLLFASFEVSVVPDSYYMHLALNHLSRDARSFRADLTQTDLYSHRSRSLKISDKLYYLYSENKGADQLKPICAFVFA